MTYAFVHDVPADEAMYRQIRAKLGDEAPKGMVMHLAVKRESGLRYIDVWESEADWERFHAEQVEPAVDEVLAAYGLPHDHSLVAFEALELVDIWSAERSGP